MLGLYLEESVFLKLSLFWKSASHCAKRVLMTFWAPTRGPTTPRFSRCFLSIGKIPGTMKTLFSQLKLRCAECTKNSWPGLKTVPGGRDTVSLLKTNFRSGFRSSTRQYICKSGHSSFLLKNKLQYSKISWLCLISSGQASGSAAEFWSDFCPAWELMSSEELLLFVSLIEWSVSQSILFLSHSFSLS